MISWQSAPPLPLPLQPTLDIEKIEKLHTERTFHQASWQHIAAQQHPTLLFDAADIV